jgi:oligosaccharyltransferase complex subunit beta
MFSDRFFDVSSAANEEFCIELSKWVFGERGILRASDVTHIRKDGTPAEILLHQKERLDLPASQFPEPEIAKNSQVYRIKDDILYSLVLEEYDEEKGGWVPYWTDDVQMELVMLDPYERVTLECDRSSGQCSTYFTAPDTYGIFKIRVMYRRPGLTVLKVHTQVSIRPFKHNEYERFIGSAMPYYAAVFSTMGAFFIFSFFFLYSSSAPRKAKSKTT